MFAAAAVLGFVAFADAFGRALGWALKATVIVLLRLTVFAFRVAFSKPKTVVAVAPTAQPTAGPDPVIKEAVSALVNLKLPIRAAERIVEQVYKPGMTVEELIKEALRNMQPK